ncbi:MAG: hypothetical protein VX947_06290, partial [Chloroflexota bacterium]|nr:hypothetical protein [Chloroflexota bacterium]
MARKDSSSELTPEDFLESRQDDSDSLNPVLDIIRNVDAGRDDEGIDGDGMTGARPATISENVGDASWDDSQTAEKTADSTEIATAEGGAAADGADDDEEPEWEPET